LIKMCQARLHAPVIAVFLGVLTTPALAPRFARTCAQSLPETVEAINKSRVSTRILFITAHPDDEWSSLLTYLSRGLNADVALLTITRGQGGQNAIGPEQGGPLGAIRTEELLAAGKQYGVRQFFTRAPDTGYLKSPEQAMKVWGDIALEDMVRVIRTFRPQVVINGWGGVHGGHGHHQESGILTPQAVAAAADPKIFPQQLAEGLAVWKVALEVRPARGSTAGAVELPTNDVSPLWGKSYVELGMEGHAHHRSQGTPAFFGNSFFRRPVYIIRENEKGDSAGAFDAKLLAEPITVLASRFPSFQPLIAPALAVAEEQLAAARKSVLALDRPAAAKSLAAAGNAVTGLQSLISKLGGAEASGALWEFDQLRKRIDLALADDVALTILAQAERHELVAGESFTVEITLPGRSAVPVKWTLDKSNLLIPPGWTAAPGDSKEPSIYHFTVTIPAGAKPPSSPGDAILPYPPPLVRVELRVNLDGYAFPIAQPVESVETATTGIHAYSLELVPAVTLTVDPQHVMVPLERAVEPVKLLARVRYHGTPAARVAVGLDTPQGWTVQPIDPLDFKGAGDQLIRFVVTPPAQPPAGTLCQTRRQSFPHLARADSHIADAQLERARRSHGSRDGPGRARTSPGWLRCRRKRSAAGNPPADRHPGGPA
jgi:LmbE family N-acetylglucosaminyl deacetylase